MSYLTKKQASDFFTHELGLPLSEKTLSKMICVGGGPEYRKFGRRVVYDPEALQRWANQRLSQPRTFSMEGNAHE